MPAQADENQSQLDSAELPGADIEYPDASQEAQDPDEAKGGANLVYWALAGGAAVLALLLLIVWYSSQEDSSDTLPLCLDIDVDNALDAVMSGDVEQIDALLDESDPLKGLTAVQLQLINGECRRLPEGADNRDGLYQILGAADLYNEAGDRRIDIEYLRQDVPAALLVTSTPQPSPTAGSTSPPESSATSLPEPTATAAATKTPSPEPTATRNTASPQVVVSGSASPVASPMGSPVASASASATSIGTPNS